MRPFPSRRCVLGIVGAGILAVPPARAGTRIASPVAIDVTATPMRAFRPREPERARFGALSWRGGLVLSSRHGAFGGISGLSMGEDGTRLVAISDRGTWLTARLQLAAGRPQRLDDVVLAPMLDATGRPLARGRAFDTESLCLHDGTAYVGVERVNQVLRFDWRRSGFAARSRAVPLPGGAAGLPFNRGLEAIGVMTEGASQPGALVAIAERSRPDSAAPTLGFILTGPARGAFDVARGNDFDVTDLVFLPGGDMLLLERRFAPLRGVAMRIRRVAGRTIRPGALVDGTVLLEADMGEEIDNMEAIGFHRDAAGTGIVTLMSDDNFSILQRTILLQFALDAA